VIRYSYRDLAGEAIHVDEQKLFGSPTLSEQELRKTTSQQPDAASPTTTR